MWKNLLQTIKQKLCREETKLKSDCQGVWSLCSKDLRRSCGKKQKHARRHFEIKREMERRETQRGVGLPALKSQRCATAKNNPRQRWTSNYLMASRREWTNLGRHLPASLSTESLPRLPLTPGQVEAAAAGEPTRRRCNRRSSIFRYCPPAIAIEKEESKAFHLKVNHFL